MIRKQCTWKQGSKILFVVFLYIALSAMHISEHYEVEAEHSYDKKLTIVKKKKGKKKRSRNATSFSGVFCKCKFLK